MSAHIETVSNEGSGVESPLQPRVQGFFDPYTYSVQYVVSDPATNLCVIIDPVLDYDEKSGSTATRSADAILNYVSTRGLSVAWILDTHPHADHFSAAGYLKDVTGAPTGIGEHVVEIQKLWKSIYNLPDSFPTDGSQWDHRFADGETFRVGEMKGEVIFSPGHTVASISYLFGDAAFVHDTLFMPDSGTARADFPSGAARQLWRSIQRILSLPGQTRLYTGHDYQPGGRAPAWESTVALQKANNMYVRGQDEASFVKLRAERDQTLPMPRLMLSALQVNIAGGRLPTLESNGHRYLKIPLNAFVKDAENLR
jgi:glyoxylase-like metal-dependent hydrolase (beta-lactamase superfamily II)